MLLQFLHIINLFSLLFSTTGLLVHQHYCQDKLKTLSFYAQSTKDCCKKHQNYLTKTCDSTQPQIHKKPCCENRTIFNIDDSVQDLSIINNDFVSTSNIGSIVNFARAEITMEQQFLLDKNKELRYYSYKAPPHKAPLHLLLCTFLC